MTNLNSVNMGDNPFCGPAVLSVFTGEDTDTVARNVNIQVRHTRPNAPITGMYFSELMTYLTSKDLRYEIVQFKGTLFRFLTLGRPGKYIVMVPHHFVAVEITPAGERFFIDNRTAKAINGASAARLGNKVIGILKVG